jgi:hypothetical protein
MKAFFGKVASKIFVICAYLFRVVFLLPVVEYLQSGAESMVNRQTANEVENANYDLFCKHRVEARNSLAKAISADENRKLRVDHFNVAFVSALNTKRNVLKLYTNALESIRQALQVRVDRCPIDKRQQMETDRRALETNLTLALERAERLCKS